MIHLRGPGRTARRGTTDQYCLATEEAARSPRRQPFQRRRQMVGCAPKGLMARPRIVPAIRAGPALAGDTQVSQGEIALRVSNHNFLDVTIYVVHDGQRTRVGTVTGSSSQVFFLPFRLLGQGREIQLLGDPIGSTQLARTERLVVQPGQYIDWTLETELR